MRRVPFSLKDKVTAKIDELLEKEVIEKVDGPTTWVSPVVVAPKAPGLTKPLFVRDFPCHPLIK